MDLKEKIKRALLQHFKAEFVRLEDDEGISGFVVARQFKGISALDRQEMIDKALSKVPQPLSKEERRQVLMIAALTPAEYDAVGARIRVRGARIAAGTIEVVVDGSPSDAEYVRGILNNQENVRTTKPTRAQDGLFSFQVKGLTMEGVLRFLEKDAYIEVLPEAVRRVAQ
jgi:acid stress-induced BolA-like protein IbaG/YrbA